MFILWGKKAVHKKIGYVADFCPICRTPQPFAITRVGSAGHLYFVSAGEGQLVGYERTCQKCRTPLNAEPTTYASLAKRAAPLDELLRSTFPNLTQALQERLAIEERVQRDPASLEPELRRSLIRNPFVRLSPKVEKRFADATHMDWTVGLALIGAIALIFSAPDLAHKVAPGYHSDLLFWSPFVLGIALVVWQMIASGKRFMRKEIIPVLAGTLAPLRPTEDEITAVLAELKQLGHKIGSKIKPANLMARMK